MINSTNEFHDINKELPEPWYLSSVDLTEQLFREISKNHILFAKSLKTIARRQDKDDVLFQIENDQFKYVVEHLTWSKTQQPDKRWPTAKLYKDWNDLYANRIVTDNVIFKG